MDERDGKNGAASLHGRGEGSAVSTRESSAAAPEMTQSTAGTVEAVEASMARAKAALTTEDGAERRTGLVGDRTVAAAERTHVAQARAGHSGPADGIDPRTPLWIVLALPLLWLLLRWAIGAATYGDVVRWSGFWAALLLVPTTLVTPLGLLYSQARWVAWSQRRRHDLGVACVAYAAVHTATYVIGKGSLALILREGRQPWLLAGWATLAVFVIFAAVRAHAARRGLGPSWTRRHRIIYIGSALIVLHWALSAFDPLTIQVQTALRAYGYYAGPIDGLIGSQSRQALSRLQRDRGLEVTGAITPEVLDVLGIIPN